MKRLIALILVVLMLGSTAAFATSDTQFGVGSLNDSVTGEASDLTDEGAKSMATELWLQVAADGQIDVTVPLLLVFKTNIDGGSATAPTNYKIMNNNNAPIVVTDVVVTEGEERTDVPGTLALVDYENGALAEDKYKVKITVDADVVPTNGATEFDFFDETDTYASYNNPAANGGLFKLNRDTTNAVKTPTAITAEMATGRFSFITPQLNNELNGTKGVHLNTVTYTVAFDASVVAGGDMTNGGDIEWNDGTDNTITVAADPDDTTTTTP